MLQDLRFAFRAVWRSRVFAIGAVTTLALGIGVNATMFSLASTVLFRPLTGISSPERLVWISSLRRDRGQPAGLSFPDYLDYKAASAEVFADVLAFCHVPMSLGTHGHPERTKGHAVSGSYFPVLGVTPAIGRLFGPVDDVRGGVGRVAVISHRLWKERFAGRSNVLQQTILINGRQFAIVGVAAEGFQGPALGETAEVWVPFAAWPDLRSSEPALLENRGSSWLSVMARLRPEVSVDRAAAVLSSVAARLEAEYPDSNRNLGVIVGDAGSPIPPGGRREVVPVAALLLTVTGLVLMIACANVANLLLARGVGRSVEISVRAAIGASRGRLVRQFLMESMVLAAIGAAAGLLLSFWAADLLIALASPEAAGIRTGVDPRVVGYTILLTVVSVCAFGLAPALVSTRGSLLPTLRMTPSAGGVRRSRFQSVFVVTQLALSLVLLLAAGLSLRALQKSSRIDLGFDAHNVTTASYDLVLQNYPVDRRDGFRRELLARLRATPGVESAAIANLAPLSGTMVGGGAEVPDAGDRALVTVFLNAVDAAYFSTMRIPIVRGRPFGHADVHGSNPVAIVNQTLAQTLWGSGDPIGKTIRLQLTAVESVQVVGIARDSKYDEPTEDPRPFLYLALAQRSAFDSETVIVRSAAIPAGAIELTIHALDPTLPVFDVRPFDGLLRDRADKQRAMSALLAGFGALAMLLAAVGLYGVVAFTTAQRTREMGLRLALGATPAQLARLIAGDGLRLALIGTAIGSALAIPLARVIGTLIFGVEIADIAAFVLACVIMIGTAVFASLVPAGRAVSVDPMSALRSE